MSIRLGFSVGPFFISGGGSRRRRPTGKHARFGYASYWLFGFPIELCGWMLAGELLLVWWLLWATMSAVLYEVTRFHELPAWWGPVVDNTRPVWPKRKPALTAPSAAGWHPKTIR